LQYTQNSELTRIFYSCIAVRIQVSMLTRHSTVAVHSQLKFPWYWSFHGIQLLQYTQNSSHPANKDIYQSQCTRNSSFHANQDILKWQSSSSMLPRIFYSHSARRTPTSWTGTIFFLINWSSPKSTLVLLWLSPQAHQHTGGNLNSTFSKDSTNQKTAVSVWTGSIGP